MKHDDIIKQSFTDILTSDCQRSDMIVPQKEPYIIFRKIVHDDQDRSYLDLISNTTKLFSLGLVKKEGNMHTLTITSARKVIQAINIYLQFSGDDITKDNDVNLGLTEYIKKCQLIQENKNKKVIPLKSQHISQYTIDHSFSLPKSSNTTYRVIKNFLSTKQSKFVYKENTTGRSISEIEAFNACCYRLLLGKQHPKVRGVHGENAERKGVVSEWIPGYISLKNYVIANKGPLTKQKILDSKMIRILVSSYTEEETDLHSNNFGFDHEGLCIKIDDDRSAWSLTSKYVGVDPEKGNGNPLGLYPTPPISDFIITKEDISSFPTLNDATPFQWIHKLSNQAAFKKEVIDALMTDKQFIDDKYYMFLKRILITREVYEAIAVANSASSKTRTKLIEHKVSKTEKLKKILLEMAEFQDYIISNTNVIDQIKNEFLKYNEDYKKSTDKYLHINLNQISDNFTHLVDEVKEKTIDRKLQDEISPEKQLSEKDEAESLWNWGIGIT